MDEIEILSRDNYELDNKIFREEIRESEIKNLKNLKKPTCLLGETVIHPTYGKGIAFEFGEDFKYIEIMFNVVGAKKFIFPEAFNMVLKFENEKTQKKMEELMKDIPKRIREPKRSHSGLIYDPVEDTEEYLKIEDEVNKLAQERMGNIRGIGSCYIFWRAKKQILKEKYGIDWKSPSELNLHVMFD